MVNLDTKGRFSVPNRYREIFIEHSASQLVVTIDTEDNCLLLYPHPEWQLIEAQIEALPSFNRATRRIQRLLIGHATEIEMDSLGRVLLPTPLRLHAGLEKRMVLVGQGKKFEVWDETRWSNCRDAWLAEEQAYRGSNELPAELQKLSL